MPFRLLAATDGSASAHGALATALAFPWPHRSRARAVVALGRTSSAVGRTLRAATVRSLYQETERARRLLGRRWPEADAVALHDSAADAILAEARRFDADAIALGWRGHGAMRRLLAGSVSRAVVVGAACPVLVARSAARTVRRLVVGFDGSPAARRALRFLTRLAPPRGSLAIVVTVTQPLRIPGGTPRLPRPMRASLRGDALRYNRARDQRAQMQAQVAVAALKRAGWAARVKVETGATLETLLAACKDLRGDVLVVGRRARRSTSTPLGSVSTGVLNHSPIPVLIVP